MAVHPAETELSKLTLEPEPRILQWILIQNNFTPRTP